MQDEIREINSHPYASFMMDLLRKIVIKWSFVVFKMHFVVFCTQRKCSCYTKYIFTRDSYPSYLGEWIVGLLT